MKTLKLQGKMLLSILSTLLLVLALIVGYVSHRAGQVVLQDAQRIAESETRAQALVIENRVESMQVGARALAGALAGTRLALTKGAAYVRPLFLSVTTVLIGKQIWDLF